MLCYRNSAASFSLKYFICSYISSIMITVLSLSFSTKDSMSILNSTVLIICNQDTGFHLLSQKASLLVSPFLWKHFQFISHSKSCSVLSLTATLLPLSFIEFNNATTILSNIQNSNRHVTYIVSIIFFNFSIVANITSVVLVSDAQYSDSIFLYLTVWSLH